MDDQRYIKYCLELAEKGLGKVSPNPMVGCVIVKDGKIIGEGYHQQYGGPHAEVNAVNSVAKKNDIEGSTIYVSLEPCSHFGKTPPCAELLLEVKPKRVVVANVDPNPLVAGKGLEKLKQAGIDVEVGVMSDEGKRLNKRFFTFMEKKRPYIVLKWAQTLDGFIARENYDSKWISGEASRKLVHQWRSEEEGIMVGTKTVLHDNPTLNVRHVEGRDPIRIVVDKNLKISPTANVFNQQQPTLCYNAIEDRTDEYNQFIKIDFSKDIIPQILFDLFQRKVQSLFVEGGAQLLQSFLDLGLWDEARVFTSQTLFEKGIQAPEIDQLPSETITVGDDQLMCYNNH